MLRLPLLAMCMFIALYGKVSAQGFKDVFCDKTLRLDYIFSGTNCEQQISLSEMAVSDGWYGRRNNLDSLLLLGNGQIVITDTAEAKVLYSYSFSTLFQEWQNTEEATRIRRSFENVFLVPMPLQPVDITLTLTDTHNKACASMTHRLDPEDILIRKTNCKEEWRYLLKSGDSREKIDIAFVPEGYTSEEMEVFENDCRESMYAIMSHEPFASLGDRFNFVAVFASSEESGVSIPHEGLWRNTLLGGSFDTFYSERYLTTLHLKRLHDILTGIPYEHIVILSNTDNYGGGGIYNSYLMSAAHNKMNRPVVVHEFGHSYAGLADEYYYDDQYDTMYPADTEPWEPNITTLVDFGSKWQDMLPQRKTVPTKPNGKDLYTGVGVYEGGGYQSKGVYRPVQECRMKINDAPVFCPVCERAIRRMTDYYTK